MTSLVSLSLGSFEDLVRRGTRTVIVEFSAPWCRHCRAIEPMMVRLEVERPDLAVLQVNVDDYPELAAEFDVLSIPTLIRFERGKPSRRSLGGSYEGLLEELGLAPLPSRAAA
jgi:thioredoxin 1